MSIHVDFTPMVDMNMLLITFFMLCTTMIKSQTLQIALPTNEKLEQEQQNKTKQSEAVTLILDTERDERGHVVTEVDELTGRTYPKHVVYYYEGKPEVARRGQGWRSRQPQHQGREVPWQLQRRDPRHPQHSSQSQRAGSRQNRRTQGSVEGQEDHRG